MDDDGRDQQCGRLDRRHPRNAWSQRYHCPQGHADGARFSILGLEAVEQPYTPASEGVRDL